MKHLYPVFALMVYFLTSESLLAQKKLSVIGSSTAACYNIQSDSCYVGRLQQFYGNTIQITNLAVAGSNVYRGMPSSYSPPAERNNETPDTSYNITAALKSHPDVVLVNYPSNGYDIYSVSEIMFCLRTISETARNAGARCYITTTQPRSEPASYSTTETRKRMAEIKDSVLQQFGAFAIDFWNDIVNPADSTIIADLSQGDGTHLNNKGHAILFQKVKDKNIFGPEAPLPVSYLSISASASKGENMLVWKTALEKNIQLFQVLRSDDGIHFQILETIKPANSASVNNYSFIDKSPVQGLNYYQIAAVDMNNSIEYSKVVKIVSAAASFSLHQVYYSNNLLYAKFEADERQVIDIQVLNSAGQVLVKHTKVVNGGITTIPVNVTLANKAIYFVRITGARSETLVRSFMRP